jgi:deazaflavin-dependent oxidoreductase (nitroreductase family)
MNRSARSRFGRFMARHVAPKVDPWLGRISNGRVSLGMFNVPSATLKTTGAKSGQPREAQVAYFHDGRDVVVLASNYGGAKHPQWYHNLIAHPDCELGGEAFHATEMTDPDEYARLFALAEQHFDLFADYRTKSALTGRKIPVFRFTPRGG